MAIRVEDVNERVRRIFPSGRLDTAGSEAIAPQFAEQVATAKGGVIVYLSAVKFLSSMAIRVLVAGAKAVQARSGRMVLHVADNEIIVRTLEATGVNDLIPTYRDAESAEKALLQ